MFISRKHYDDLRAEWTKNHEEARVLSEQNHFLRTTLDWMRVRLTQVEHERALMIYNYTGVKVKSPSFEKETENIPGTNMRQGSVSDALQASATLFADVGDAEAAKQGIIWDEFGNVSYSSST